MSKSAIKTDLKIQNLAAEQLAQLLIMQVQYQKNKHKTYEKSSKHN